MARGCSELLPLLKLETVTEAGAGWLETETGVYLSQVSHQHFPSQLVAGS